MTKSELASKLARQQPMLQYKAEETVEIIFEAMTEALADGERIELRGFGTFCLREYRAYTSHDPRNGTPVSVKPKKLPYFKAGKDLREKVAGVAK